MNLTFLRKALLLTCSLLSFLPAVTAGEINGITISGRIKPFGEAVAILAFCPDENEKYAGRVNSRTGSYSISKLPEGIYDIVLRTKRYLIEGIRFWPKGELTGRDIKEIEEIVESVDQFFNRKKIIRISGSSNYASAIVEQVRDMAYYLNSGEKISGKIIRRIDFLRFKKSGRSWVSIENKHLYREEVLSNSPEAEMEHMFEKKFSGIKVVGTPSVKIADYQVPAN